MNYEAQMKAMDAKEYICESTDHMARKKYRFRSKNYVNADLKCWLLMCGYYMYENTYFNNWLVYLVFDMETRELKYYDYYQLNWFWDPTDGTILSKKCVDSLPVPELEPEDKHKDKNKDKVNEKPWHQVWVEILKKRGITTRKVYLVPSMKIRERYGKNVQGVVDVIQGRSEKFNEKNREEWIQALKAGDEKKEIEDCDEKTLRLQICLYFNHPYHSEPMYGTDFPGVKSLHSSVTGKNNWLFRIPYIITVGMF